MRESTERAFEAYVATLENVTAFRYLGRVMTAGDDGWPAVVGKLQKARKSWGAVVADFEPGGGRSEGVGTFFQGGETGGVVIQGGEVGTNLQDGAVPEWFSTQGCAKAHREAAEETRRWELGVPRIGGSNDGSRIRGDRNIHHK